MNVLKKYEDFYLIVNGIEGRYTVEAQGPGQISTDPVPFVYRDSFELWEELEEIQAGYSPSREAMRRVGTLLFEALMPPPILLAFGRAGSALSQGQQLRLRLNIRPAELARLPWELLFHPHDESFLATRRSQPLVRFLDSSSKPVASLQIEGPLKVLLVQAAPRDLSQLNLADSEQALWSALGRRAEITVLPHATPAKLRTILRSQRESFHVLHYDGHGLFDEDEEGEGGYLALENEEGDVQPLSGRELANYLDGTDVRLVVLAACESAMDSTRQRFVGVAQRLMRASNLPAVVAMQFAIEDDSVIAFIRGFYGALADAYPVDVAVSEGRLAILERTGLEAADWATPLLLMRTTDGSLWERFIDDEPVKPLLNGYAPYMGLNTFTEEDTPFFFGREGLIKVLLEQLQESLKKKIPFLAVIGPSGSGKSSVVFAGLLPILKRGQKLPGSDQWCYLPPIRPGTDPLQALAVAIVSLQGDTQPGRVTAMRNLFMREPRTLLDEAALFLADQPNKRLVVIIDQFEELWTQAPNEPEARQQFVLENQQPFINLLISAMAVPNSPILLILTMRADFLHRAAENRDLARYIGGHDVIVSSMKPYELRRAIEQPAIEAGGIFEAGLVDELIAQTAQREGALPLLSYSLLDLWQNKQPNAKGIPAMTWEAFRACGGVEGALAARADDILAAHYTPAEQDELRHLLLRLVQPNDDITTRRRRLLSELVPADANIQSVQALLRPLVDERLLTTGRHGSTSDETVEISHEALIHAWPTFEEWIDDAREDLRFQLQVEEEAKEWQINQQNPDFLWNGLRLANAEAWLNRAKPRLNKRDLHFLEASRAEEQARIEAALKVQHEREVLLEKARHEAKRRAEAEQRNAKRLYLFMVMGALLSFLTIFLVLRERVAYAEVQEQARRYESLAVSSEELLDLYGGNPNRGLVLALASLIDMPDHSFLVERALQRIIAETRLIQQVPIRHSADIWSMAWSPNGQTPRILTGGEDRTAWISEATTGIPLLTLTGHTDSVMAVAWSPTGAQVVTGGKDGTVRLWDAERGDLLQTLYGLEAVWSVAWSPDGQKVLTGHEDHNARLWDVTSGKLLYVLEGHEGRINTVAWHPASKQVVTGSDDHTARLWNAETGKALHTLSGHEESINSVAWSPNGKLILTGSNDKTARLWDATTGKALHTLQGQSAAVLSVAWHPTSRQVATGSADNTARIWQIEHSSSAIKTTELYALTEHTAPVLSVAWHSDGKQLLTGSQDKRVRLWIAENALVIARLTEYSCNLFTDSEIQAEITEWRGCEIELQRIAEDLEEYKRVRGEQ